MTGRHAPPADAGRPPRCDVLVQRQLGDHAAGSATYLAIFLAQTRAAGFEVRLVMAPERSFSNRPWGSVHPRLAALADRIDWPRARRVGRTYVSLSPRVYLRFALRLLREGLQRLGLRGGFATVRSLLGDEPSPSDASALLRRAAAEPAALTVGEYSALGPLLAKLPGGGVKAVLLHDLFSLRALAMREAGYEPDFRTMTLEEEARRCAPADALLFASASERDALAPFLPGRPAIWVRPDVGEQRPGADDGTPRVVFIGTRHAGNFDALAVLLDEIWPAVARRAPGVELHVVGSIGEGLPARWSALPGLRARGRVENLAEVGGARSIGVAPTRAASGVSIKVAEYMRLGMAVVAMPAAVEGFGTALDDLLVRAHDPAAFAEAVAGLLADHERRRALARRGRAEIGARLSNEELSRFLHGVAAGAGPVRGDESVAAVRAG